jgi:hypothetical protein
MEFSLTISPPQSSSIRCKKCGCTISVQGSDIEAVQQAVVKKWNTRSADRKQVQWCRVIKASCYYGHKGSRPLSKSKLKELE